MVPGITPGHEMAGHVDAVQVQMAMRSQVAFPVKPEELKASQATPAKPPPQ